MKRYILSAMIVLFLSGVFLTACGGKEEGKKPEESTWQGIEPGMADLTAITERTEYYDVKVEAEDLFSLGLEEKMLQEKRATGLIAPSGITWVPVGTQFLQGEPVQLWAEADPDGSDIYLYRKDGSRELLVENISNEYISSRLRPSGQWYMDQQGDYYCYGNAMRQVGNDYGVSNSFLAKILSSGEILYEVATESDVYIRDICQAEDGKVYLLLDDRTVDKIYGVWKIAEVDPGTGEPVKESVMELPWKYMIILGKEGNFPAVTGENEGIDRTISRVDPEEGSLSPILYFTGLSYGWHSDLELQDFLVQEDGGIELLWTRTNGAGGLWERLKIEKVEKIPIVVRGSFYGDTWLGNKVLQFNRENSNYHVVVEDCGSGNDKEDFARLTSIQIGAGGGPDIINGGLMKDYMEGLLDKDVVEDLTPYMEASAVREEEYFPLTFASLRQGGRIYGVNPEMTVWDYKMAVEVLEGLEAPDIETLADALLALKGEGVYCKGYDSARLLRMFLQGTESFWGMVDWESGSCEFNTPLFGKLLEAAKRYDDNGRKNTESIAVERVLYSVLHLEGQARLMEKEMEEKVTQGILFDDGSHAACSWEDVLCINANSLHKEGAWEFIHFLISEEAQSSDFRELSFPPVHRKAYDVWEQWLLDNYTNVYREGYDIIRAYNGIPLTDEMLVEFRERIEGARPLPIRNEPLLNIILEEAEDYFNGYKNAEEISGVINKRVQLYLDERK